MKSFKRGRCWEYQRHEIFLIVRLCLLFGAGTAIVGEMTFGISDYIMFPSSEYDVTISDELMSTLNDMYLENPDKEFGGCLNGIQHKNNILLTDITNVELGTRNRVELRCKNETDLGTIHSHPSSSPYASSQDLATFHLFFNEYNHRIEMVMIGVDRIKVFEAGDIRLKGKLYK